MWAHVYLNGFDHFVKRELKVPGYVRFVDDFFLFGDGRGELRCWRRAARAWHETHRGLRLKHPEARILSCRGSLNALGYRLRRGEVEALPRALGRLARRAAAEARPGRRREGPELRRSAAASAGVLLF